MPPASHCSILAFFSGPTTMNAFLSLRIDLCALALPRRLSFAATFLRETKRVAHPAQHLAVDDVLLFFPDSAMNRVPL